MGGGVSWFLTANEKKKRPRRIGDLLTEELGLGPGFWSTIPGIQVASPSDDMTFYDPSLDTLTLANLHSLFF